MTDQEIIKAIAESQGYQNVQPRLLGFVGGLEPDFDCMVRVPDYPSDLNAMHVVEKTLDDNQWEAYWYALARLTPGRPTSVCHATARQRAEAYLRAKGKWV